MKVTPQRKLISAYNEFVREFCDENEMNQATIDEAHERAAWCVSLGQSVAEMFVKFKLDTSQIDFVTDAIPDIEPDEAYLFACAVAVALEEVK